MSEQPLIDPGLHPVHFVLADGGEVQSYARTMWASVSHVGTALKLYGLGDVVTRPEARRRGYARWLVGESTSHIEFDVDADAALLLTAPELEALYRKCGWDRVPGLRVVTGEHGRISEATTIPCMIFLSEKARALRERFTSQELVLPGDEW